MTVLYGRFGQAQILSQREGHPVSLMPDPDGNMPDELGLASVIDLPSAQPQALEHIQAGANTIAHRLGERVIVTTLVGADYFMRSIVGAGNRYVAGRAGMSDFFDSLSAIVNTDDESSGDQDTLLTAHRIYGTYCVGRELLRSAIPVNDPTFRRVLDGYREHHQDRLLPEAQQAVYNRFAATAALLGVKDVLSQPAQRKLLRAVKRDEFPLSDASVANDFHYHVGSAKFGAMINGHTQRRK